MKVINLLGGPGTRKTTFGAGLFYCMKMNGYNVELVTEYVKEAAYEKRPIFDDQVYIFGVQNRRMHILKNDVDWIVTDSPLLLSYVYAPENYYPAFNEMVLEAHDSYENYNFLMNRFGPYEQRGRNETEEEALDVDQRLLTLLGVNEILYEEVSGTNTSVLEIMKLMNFKYDVSIFQ